MENYLLMILLFSLAASGNVLLKFGLSRVSLPEIRSVSSLIQSVILLIKSPIMWLVFCMYVPSVLIYFYLLRKLELTYFGPILTSSVLILVLMLSWIFLKEQITLIRVIGILFIVLGVFLVAKS